MLSYYNMCLIFHVVGFFADDSMQMDTASPFDDWIQSAESASASLVVLLAAAQVLGTHKELLRTAPNDVLFALFHEVCVHLPIC